MMRRLRGFLSTTLTVGLPLTALGALTGLAVQLGAVPGLHLSGLVGPGAFLGGLIGVLAGTSYSSLIFATERGKRLEQLSLGRFALWGGLAMAMPVGLLFHNPLVAATGALLGAVLAPTTLAVARRGTPDAPVLPRSTQSPTGIRAPST
jgi:hypothetical protein